MLEIQQNLWQSSPMYKHTEECFSSHGPLFVPTAEGNIEMEDFSSSSFVFFFFW